jgi:hypothetical protein
MLILTALNFVLVPTEYTGCVVCTFRKDFLLILMFWIMSCGLGVTNILEELDATILRVEVCSSKTLNIPQHGVIETTK